MNDADHPAAQFCEGLSIGGYTDWYMPAKNELEVCYYNLKPSTDANNTSYGINDNAVPARTSNYTSGDPAQTSAAAFITSTGAEAFTTGYYWSSTQDTITLTAAYMKRFTTGREYISGKNNNWGVRAIRRVAV
jgi:hypothetical protein